jgi:succinate dehydrogenase/fumarate reductase cytochrome b subunit
MSRAKAKATYLRTAKRWHYYSGLTLSVFIAFHLFNQLVSLAGPGAHIAVMKAFRNIYRHPVIETLLLTAVLSQVITGTRLLLGRKCSSRAEKVQLYSGLYLSFFLFVHVSAVLCGRYLGLDTNFYYAGAGLNYYPATFFFIPYYFLAVAAIAFHIAAIHFLKTGSLRGAYLIGAIGVLAAIAIIAGFTDTFNWRTVPAAYQEFIHRFF